MLVVEKVGWIFVHRVSSSRVVLVAVFQGTYPEIWILGLHDKIIRCEVLSLTQDSLDDLRSSTRWHQASWIDLVECHHEWTMGIVIDLP